jgi:hypothetical protein
MAFEVIAAESLQACPIVFFWNGALFSEHGRVFGVHFQEEQAGELLNVIAIGHAVVAQDVAVVPEMLDNCG